MAQCESTCGALAGIKEEEKEEEEEEEKKELFLMPLLQKMAS